MRAYSLDLRQKIVGAFERGLTKSEVARTFGVSFSSVKRYVKMNAQRGSLAPSKPPGSPPKIDDRARRLLELDLQERPAVGTRPTEEAPPSRQWRQGIRQRADPLLPASAEAYGRRSPARRTSTEAGLSTGRSTGRVTASSG
jgi:transposase-like protein